MPATRNLKSIADTLSGVRSDHRFLKVSPKEGGGFTVTRVQVSGQQTVWKKHPDVVYSPATGLAGRPHDVLEYLRHRDDNSDDSSAGVIQAFEDDKSHWITPESYDDNHAVIEQMTFHRKAAAAPAQKMTLIEPLQIPDLLQRVRDMRGQTPSTRVSKFDVIGTYLKVLEDDPAVRYRIHNCAADGSGLRKTNSTSISSQSIPLSSDTHSHLSRFYIPSNYENRKFVSNFMTRYYMYEDKLRPADAAAKAKAFAEDLLAPYKKAKKTTTRGRSVSPKGGRSSSPGAKKQTAGRTRSSSTTKTVSRAASHKVASHKDGDTHQVARSSSPRKTTVRASRSKSPVHHDVGSPAHSASESPPRSASKSPPRSASKSPSRAASKSPPRTASRSPSRSPSPSTSPKVTASKTLRLPKRK